MPAAVSRPRFRGREPPEALAPPGCSQPLPEPAAGLLAETAEILKLGQSAVKMRLKRGRELLKIELEGSN